MKKVLLVEPGYKTKYPPLALMKISTFHKNTGDNVTYVKGINRRLLFKHFDLVYVTSLFTYEAEKAVETVNFYKIGSQFTRDFFHDKLRSHIEREDLNSYYELIIEEALKENWLFYGLDAEEIKWWEIDTQEDLKYCESLFS